MTAALVATAPLAAARTPDAVVVFAAGSLRAALTETAAAFEHAQPGRQVRLVFGASGLLKDRLAGGEQADVFASANMEHPEALAAAGKASAVQRFARNALCALASPKLDVGSASLVERLLDPSVKVGTSTPKADPSGDYAFAMFERIDQQRPGAYKTLAGKALQLTGGPQSPPPPAGRNVYGMLVAEGQADVYITYCTNATAALREQPGLNVVQVPAAINVAASYGVAMLRGAGPSAQAFVDFLLAPAGQAILARHGFTPP
jgi:ABC-type molybdate transport system substrate-binding protein